MLQHIGYQKNRFYGDLQLLDKIAKAEPYIILGNLNAHVGSIQSPGEPVYVVHMFFVYTWEGVIISIREWGHTS